MREEHQTGQRSYQIEPVSAAASVAELGRPENVTLGMAITRKCLRDEFGDDVSKLPVPTFPSMVIFDPPTENFIYIHLPKGETYMTLLARLAPTEQKQEVA